MHWITVVAATGAVSFTAAAMIGLAKVALSIIRTPDEWLGPHAEFERLRQRERRIGGLSMSFMAVAVACAAVWLIY